MRAKDPDAPLRIFLLFLIVAAAFGLLMYGLSKNQKPFVHPHISAPAYVWSRACPEAAYGAEVRADERGFVPIGCAREKYAFNEADDYGFEWYGKGPRKYYRVGNDIILLGCHTVFSDCVPTDVIRDAFYQEALSQRQ